MIPVSRCSQAMMAQQRIQELASQPAPDLSGDARLNVRRVSAGGGLDREDEKGAERQPGGLAPERRRVLAVTHGAGSRAPHSPHARQRNDRPARDERDQRVAGGVHHYGEGERSLASGRAQNPTQLVSVVTEQSVRAPERGKSVYHRRWREKCREMAEAVTDDGPPDHLTDRGRRSGG